MPKSSAAFAIALVMLTSIVSWQLFDLATTRPGSAPAAQSRERLASAALPGTPQILAAATIEPIEPAISPRTPLLERFTLGQFARYEIPPHAGVIIIAESGNLRVQAPTETSNSTDASTFSNLTAGQSFTAPAGAPVTLANMDLQPATVLLLTIPPFDPADEQWAPSIRGLFPVGVTRDTQMTGFTITAHRGPLSLSMRLMQIAPGAAVAGYLVADSEMVLVESGSVEVQIRNGEVLPLTHDTPAPGPAGTTVLSGGHGVVAHAGAEIAYHATGQSPATIVLVTLAPAERAR